MRSIGLFLLSLIALCPLCALAQDANPAPASRARVTLAGEWKAQYVNALADLPGAQWDKLNFPGFTNFRAGKNALWCERTVNVPTEWQNAGKRITINMAKVAYAVTVFINGEKAGDILGYGGELDITQKIKFGTDNSIRLLFGKKGAGVQLDKVTKSIVYHLEQQVARGGHDWGSGSVGVGGPRDSFYLDCQSRDLVISDVWYRTYTRGYTRIDPLVTIDAGREISGLKAKFVVYDSETNAIVREVEYPLETLKAGENITNIPMRADHMKLWNVREPNMYLGQIFVYDKDGKEIDRSNPTTFGIREFWAEGKDLKMNNKPIHFIFEWAGNDEAGTRSSVKQGITLTMVNVPRPGSFLTEDYTTKVEACDKAGMGLCGYGVEVHWLDMTDQEVVRDYTKWCKEYLKLHRNHPAILFWGIGLNSPGNYLDFAPAKIGYTKNIDWDNIPTTVGYQIQKQIDPTRLFYFHGGPRGGDMSTGNIYFNHIPVQEVEDWLTEWSIRGDRPVLAIEFMGGPLNVDFRRDDLSFLTEFAAIQDGEAVYKEETDEYTKYATYTVPALNLWGYNPLFFSKLASDQVNKSQRLSMRSWRFYGVPQKAWSFGMGGNFFQEALKMNVPSLVWIGGPPDNWTAKDHNFFDGDTITKSAVIIHDVNAVENWVIDWLVKQEGVEKPIAAAGIEQAVGVYAREKVPFSFTAPPVAKPTPVTISMTVKKAGTTEVIAQDSFKLTIYPRAAAKISPREKLPRLAVYDPQGDTAAWLRSRGVVVEPYTPGKPIPGNVLVLGRESLKSLKAFPFSAADIARGMRVVVFEQHCDDLAKIGFRHEDRVPRIAFVRQPNHTLLAGISSEALRDWQGAGTLISPGPDGDRNPLTGRMFRCGNRGSVASAIIETPQMGPFRSLIDCEFDLAFTPLLTWQHGAGEIIFCQLDMVGRVGTEPAATTIADNLIRYVQTPLPARQEKTFFCLSDAGVNRVETLGFAAAKMSGKLNPKTQIVAITGEDKDALAASRKAITDFAAAGGDVVIFTASEALLSDPLFGGKLKLSKVTATRAARTVDKNPLLTGVGAQNLHWREPLEMSAISSTATGYNMLIGGYLGVLPQGKGRMIFIQVDPTSIDDLKPMRAIGTEPKPISDAVHLKNRRRSRWQIDRLQSLILANLGAQSSSALTQRMFEMKRLMPTTPVNKWMYIGPFVPNNPDHGVSPLGTDVSDFIKNRDPEFRTKNSRGEIVEWYTPTDSQNGMGMDGKMDMSRAYGVRLRDMATAVTQIWSSRERDAYVEAGADWWLKVQINGENYFSSDANGFGVGFAKKFKVHLKQGWNDVVCTVGAGSNGHVFWFRITNPGDVVVIQKTKAPADPPTNLPALDDLIPDNVPKGFSYYSDEMAQGDDPYAFVPW